MSGPFVWSASWQIHPNPKWTEHWPQTELLALTGDLCAGFAASLRQDPVPPKTKRNDVFIGKTIDAATVNAATYRGVHLRRLHGLHKLNWPVRPTSGLLLINRHPCHFPRPPVAAARFLCNATKKSGKENAPRLRRPKGSLALCAPAGHGLTALPCAASLSPHPAAQPGWRLIARRRKRG
jgi:hypothetical protein